MRYPLVVFDFDGTLADSLGPALAIYNTRIAPALNLRPIEDLEAARSTPLRQLLRQLGVRFWRLPKVIRAFQAAAAEHAHELKLHGGIPDMLAGLRTRGHRLGILSSNREDVIRAVLRNHDVEELFDFVVGYPKLFGKAKALRRILKLEKADRAEVLIDGDELRELDAGRNARVSTAAVAWGFHAETLLAAGAPRYLLRSPGELPDVATHGGPLAKVNLAEKFARFSDHWSPKIVGELNGQQVKLVKFQGEFDWHRHAREDELFLVVRGQFRMDFRDRAVWLQAGEFVIVPRGVEHRPVADEEVEVMLFEPATTLNTGNVRSERTVEVLDRV
jgi:phosphoglycolate phosphatase